jgi:hypothetical protein
METGSRLRFLPVRGRNHYLPSRQHSSVLDGPQELQFDMTGQTVNGVEFITPMTHRHLDRSDEDPK